MGWEMCIRDRSIIEIAGQIQEEVWWKYVDQDEYYQAMNDRNENFEVVVPRPNQNEQNGLAYFRNL